MDKISKIVTDKFAQENYKRVTSVQYSSLLERTVQRKAYEVQVQVPKQRISAVSEEVQQLKNDQRTYLTLQRYGFQKVEQFIEYANDADERELRHSMGCYNPQIGLFDKLGFRRFTLSPHDWRKMKETTHHLTGCGKCALCAKAHASKVAPSLVYECAPHIDADFNYTKAFMVTLTMAEIYWKQPELRSIWRERFARAFRQKVKYNGLNVRYCMVEEIGEQKGSPHFHILMVGLTADQIQHFLNGTQFEGSSNGHLVGERMLLCKEYWMLGIVHLKPILDLRQCYYLSKYIKKNRGLAFCHTLTSERELMKRFNEPLFKKTYWYMTPAAGYQNMVQHVIEQLPRIADEMRESYEDYRDNDKIYGLHGPDLGDGITRPLVLPESHKAKLMQKVIRPYFNNASMVWSDLNPHAKDEQREALKQYVETKNISDGKQAFDINKYDRIQNILYRKVTKSGDEEKKKKIHAYIDDPSNVIAGNENKTQTSYFDIERFYAENG